MILNKCPSCDIPLILGIQKWHFICPVCNYEASSFVANINVAVSNDLVKEEVREKALKELRSENFSELLDVIRLHSSAGSSLLDVGCAHGWFLDQARQYFSVMGVEPDTRFYEATKALNINVLNGYFPDTLKKEQLFDTISFNDVLEHIPDTNAVIAACHRHLSDRGILVINIPNSKGIFYTSSKLLCRLGITEFYERLWQKELPSPHLHYFNLNNLGRILEHNNFEIIQSGFLPSLRQKNLYQRITYTGASSKLKSYILFFCISAIMPILSLLPNDIMFIVARKCNDQL